MQQNETRFFELSPERTAELQGTGQLPRPLPAYSVPLIEYAFGYSLWICIAVVAVWGVTDQYRKKRRLAEDASTETSFGPPLLRTDTDRWLDQQVRPLLRPDETVQHQTYAFPGSTADGAIATTGTYVVLTTQRLFLFATRVGAFGPLHETSATEIIDRRQVVEVEMGDDRVISVMLDDGSARNMWAVPTGKASNQRAFERDVPRILGG